MVHAVLWDHQAFLADQVLLAYLVQRVKMANQAAMATQENEVLQVYKVLPV